MNINLIYAKSLNNVIGNEGKLPWHIPEDMDYFKKLTTGGVVLMGSRTWLSIPNKFRPLPDRTNVVMTTNVDLVPEIIASGAYIDYGPTPGDIAETFCNYKDKGIYKDLWVIGGASLYQQAMPYATRAYVTEIQKEYPGDTVALEMPSFGWDLESSTEETTASGTVLKYCVYKNDYIVPYEY